jgi:hypothetical protein
MRSGERHPPGGWLPPGKRAAVCFSVDDVHPGRSTDAYEGGGDMGRGALGRVEWLLQRHPQLHLTLFTTADWRELSPFPTRRVLGRIPYIRDRVFLARVLPRGTMRLDRHPEFVSYLRSLPRSEIALHGLHHVHRGPRIFVEFQEQGTEECLRILRWATEIFEAAGLPRPAGMCPPGWDVPPGLAAAMVETGLGFVASARDIVTPVTPEATTGMSGARGVSMIQPEIVEGGRLVHLPTNFQATSPVDRALEIVELGGLLGVKAHVVKTAFGHVSSDGLDDQYRNYLDALFTLLEERYGDDLWWATMGQVAERTMATSDVLAG